MVCLQKICAKLNKKIPRFEKFKTIYCIAVHKTQKRCLNLTESCIFEVEF